MIYRNKNDQYHIIKKNLQAKNHSKFTENKNTLNFMTRNQKSEKFRFFHNKKKTIELRTHLTTSKMNMLKMKTRRKIFFEEMRGDNKEVFLFQLQHYLSKWPTSGVS